MEELTKTTDSQGYVSFTRSEPSLPNSYELWAVVWGASANNVVYGGSPFGCVLLERSPSGIGPNSLHHFHFLTSFSFFIRNGGLGL